MSDMRKKKAKVILPKLRIHNIKYERKPKLPMTTRPNLTTYFKDINENHQPLTYRKRLRKRHNHLKQWLKNQYN